MLGQVAPRPDSMDAGDDRSCTALMATYESSHTYHMYKRCCWSLGSIMHVRWNVEGAGQQ